MLKQILFCYENNQLSKWCIHIYVSTNMFEYEYLLTFHQWKILAVGWSAPYKDRRSGSGHVKTDSLTRFQ